MNLPYSLHVTSKETSLTDAVLRVNVVMGLPGAATATSGRYVPPAYVVVDAVGVKVRLVVAPKIH